MIHAKQSIIVLSIKGVGILSGLIFSIYAAKNLPSPDFGRYGIFLASIAFATPIIKLGQGSYLSKTLNSKTNINPVRSTTTSLICLTITFITCLSAILTSWLVSDIDALATLTIVIATSYLNGFSHIISEYFRSVKRINTYTMLNGVAQNLVVTILVIASTAYKNLTLNDLLKLHIISSLIVTTLAYLNSPININYRLTKSIKPNCIASYARNGIPFMISNTITALNGYLTYWIILYAVGLEGAAKYTILDRVRALLLMIEATLQSTYVYKIPAIHNRAIWRFYSKNTIKQFLFLIPFYMLIALKPSLVLSVFGESYNNITAELLIITSGTAIASLFGPTGFLLQLKGHTNILIKSQLAITLVGSTNVFILTLCYGTVGSCYAISLTLIALKLLTLYQARRII